MENYDSFTSTVSFKEEDRVRYEVASWFNIIAINHSDNTLKINPKNPDRSKSAGYISSQTKEERIADHIEKLEDANMHARLELDKAYKLIQELSKNQKDETST